MLLYLIFAATLVAVSPFLLLLKRQLVQRRAPAAGGVVGRSVGRSVGGNVSAPARDGNVIAPGTRCSYTDSRTGSVLQVTVLKVHRDDVVPYYTILLPNGNERATERSKLAPLGPELPAAPAAASPAAGKRPAKSPAKSRPPSVPAVHTPSPPRRQHTSRSTKGLLELSRLSPDAAGLFRAIDTDGDDLITLDELRAFFNSWRGAQLVQGRVPAYQHDEAFVQRLHTAIDANGSGNIDFPEFRVAYQWACETSEGLRAFFDAGSADEIFAKIDTKGEGCISRRKLEAYLAKLSPRDGAAGARLNAGTILRAIDRDDDGLIDKQEFRRAHLIACGQRLSHAASPAGR